MSIRLLVTCRNKTISFYSTHHNNVTYVAHSLIVFERTHSEKIQTTQKDNERTFHSPCHHYMLSTNSHSKIESRDCDISRTWRWSCLVIEPKSMFLCRYYRISLWHDRERLYSNQLVLHTTTRNSIRNS